MGLFDVGDFYLGWESRCAGLGVHVGDGVFGRRGGSLLLTFHPRPVSVLYIFQPRHNVPIYLQEEVIRNDSNEEGLSAISAALLPSTTHRHSYRCSHMPLLSFPVLGKAGQASGPNVEQTLLREAVACLNST